MTTPLRFTARDSHLNEYPDPISFTKGTSLIIHENYEGVEEWENWFYCTIPGHNGGWVPGQILARDEGTNRGFAKEDYTARELEVNKGDKLVGLKSLNGWMWCERLSDGQSGWVPFSLLHKNTAEN